LGPLAGKLARKLTPEYINMYLKKNGFVPLITLLNAPRVEVKNKVIGEFATVRNFRGMSMSDYHSHFLGCLFLEQRNAGAGVS